MRQESDCAAFLTVVIFNIDAYVILDRLNDCLSKVMRLCKL